MEKIYNFPDHYQNDNLTGTIGQPDYIVYPETAEEAAEFLKEMNENKTPVTFIGKKTSVAGALETPAGGVLLSTDKMNNILDFNEDLLTLTVESGVPLTEIRDYLAETPYFYAPDPGAKDASIGGNVATNAGGMRALKYGVTRDNVRGLEVVLANGDIIHAGGLNRKSSSGYDMKDLFIGSEGTLGLVTKVQLKLWPKPVVSQSVLVGFESLEDSAPIVFKILQSTVTPSALELVDDKCFPYSEAYVGKKMVNIDGSYYLLMTIDGADEGAVLADVQRVMDMAEEAGAREAKRLNDEEAALMWELRDNIVRGASVDSQTATYDVVVPIDKVAETIVDMENLGKDLGISGIYFGHAGDGNIHALMLRKDLDKEAWEKGIKAFNAKLYRQIAKNGGLPAAEHGIGQQKKAYLAYTMGEPYMRAMKAVKDGLDPNNILSPNVIFE